MISPALHFNGTCKQAIELYSRAFEVTGVHIDYFDDAPADSGLNSRDMSGKVMHSYMDICGTQVNMCDVDRPVSAGDAILLNVFLKDAAAVERALSALSEGGCIKVELGPQFFSPMYAAVVDKFGIYWQLISL